MTALRPTSSAPLKSFPGCRKMLENGRSQFWKLIGVIQHYLQSDYLRISLQLAAGDLTSNGLPALSCTALKMVEYAINDPFDDVRFFHSRSLQCDCFVIRRLPYHQFVCVRGRPHLFEGMPLRHLFLRWNHLAGRSARGQLPAGWRQDSWLHPGRLHRCWSRGAFCPQCSLSESFPWVVLMRP